MLGARVASSILSPIFPGAEIREFLFFAEQPIRRQRGAAPPPPPLFSAESESARGFAPAEDITFCLYVDGY